MTIPYSFPRRTVLGGWWLLLLTLTIHSFAHGPAARPAAGLHTLSSTDATLAAGFDHTLQIRENGSLWAWGNSNSGQLGLGSLSYVSTPQPVSAGTTWASVAAGDGHSLGIRTDGSLWAWGDNSYGQLGDNTTTDRNTPVPIVAGTTWLSIAAGEFYSLAVRSDGTLWAWGYNNYGQLGDNSLTQRLAPVQVGNATTWTKVAAGWYHGLGLRANGTLYAWGRNDRGQVGDGINTTTNRLNPVQIGSATNWTQIGGGWVHSAALRTDGTLWTWGQNDYGQLGDGTMTSRNAPGQLANTWTDVAVGYAFTAGVRSPGTLWVWGSNIYGQLGQGTAFPGGVPTMAQVGTATNWQRVALGWYYVVAEQSCNTTLAWGRNNGGQLGDNTSTDRYTPMLIYNPVVLSGFSPSTAGAGTTVTVTGQRLSGVTALTVNGVSVPLSSISNSIDGSFRFVVPAGLSTTGTTTVAVGCGGASRTGFTFIQPAISGFSPTSGVAGTTITINGTGLGGTTAITFSGSSGNVVSAGFTVSNGSITGVVVPAGAITGPVSVTAAGGATATSSSNFVVPPVLTAIAPPLGQTGTVLSLTGTNLTGATAVTFSGSSGNVVSSGFTVASSTSITGIVVPAGAQTGPVTVTTPSGTSSATVGVVFIRVRALAAGTSHSLTVRADGTLWAWGQNDNGQLGDGTTTDRLTPVQVGTATTWASVAAGANFSVAVRADGTLWAWGNNFYGQLGDGSTTTRLAPVQIGTDTNWGSVAAGLICTLGVRSNGTLWGWGGNNTGQLGNGTTTDRLVPTQSGTVTTWVNVAVGQSHTLGLRADGSLWGWGLNNYGQLGTTSGNSSETSPVRVGTASNWVSMVAGATHSIALRADGALYTWGNNSVGQLGLGDTNNRSTPAQVAGTWTSIGAFGGGLAAVRANGTLWTTGYNTYGQLGLGDLNNRLAFTQVGTATNWVGATGGADFLLGEQTCRALWAWGRNDYGQVGDGSTTNRLVPVPNFVPVIAITGFSPAGAVAGASVVVTGTALNGLTALSVNGTSIPLSSVTNRSATGFTFVVPAGGVAETGTTTATTSCGSASSTGFTFAAGTPTISNFTPTTGGVGTIMSITGTGLASVTAITFAGTSGNVVTTGFTASSTSLTGVVVPPGAATGTIQVTNPAGTSAASAQTFTVCRTTATGQNASLTLAASGTGSVAASAFQASGSSTCGGTLLATVRKGGVAYGSATEGGELYLTAPAGYTFTAVDFASYGNATGTVGNYTLGSCHASNSRSVVEDALLGQTGNVTIPANNTYFGGDPCNGTAKNLRVRAFYTLSSAVGGVVYGTANEGGSLTLTAPAGTVFTSVDFASFGNATGSNGSFVAGSCQSANSRSVVEAALLGQTGSISIAATNTNFGGDPCNGTAKNLSVRATYTAGSPTLAYTCAELGTQPVLLTLTAPSGASATVPVSVSVSGPPTATLGTLSANPATLGQTVTVSGTNLAGATALTVNGVGTAISGLSATGFSFVVPASAALTGSLVLSLPCTQSLTRAFSIAPALTALSTAAELPGMPVALTGTGFSSGSTVSFGGVAAGVTYNSPTSLTAVVPVGAAAGSSAVVVSTAGGSSASSPAFEVLQVYRSTAASGCLSTASLSLTGSGGAGSWRYLRLPGAGGAVVAAIEDTYNLGTVSAGFTALGTGTSTAVRQDGGGRAYLDRNFYLTATNPAFPGQTVRVRFFGLNSELARLTAVDGNATATNLKVSQYDGANENCVLTDNDPTGERRLLAAPATVLSGADWFTAQVSVTDHFSEFYLTGASSPLPVELLAFTATAQSAAVALAWRTASEKNSARFDIERSADGKLFAQIGTVAAQGTTASPTAYAFRDSKYPGETSVLYYRLRQVDLDSTASYSPVRAVTVGGKGPLTLYPNPARTSVAVAGLGTGATVAVLDALGRPVATATADATGNARLMLSAGLAAGVYIVRSGTQARRLTVE
jgi:alpha-tubulin suppressor-like RCC1 family protein